MHRHDTGRSERVPNGLRGCLKSPFVTLSKGEGSGCRGTRRYCQADVDSSTSLRMTWGCAQVGKNILHKMAGDAVVWRDNPGYSLRYIAAKNNPQPTCFIGHFQASKTLSHPANIRALAAPGRRVQPSRHSRDRASNPFPRFDDQPAAEVVSSGPGTH